MPEPVLSVRDLVVEFETADGTIRAVDGVSWDLHPNEVLTIVGESGSGKSVSVLAILDLLAKPAARVVRGEIWFEGRNLLKISRGEMSGVRGKRISMVFQDPMASLNPIYTAGWQIEEAIKLHDRKASRGNLKNRAIELLELVHVPSAELRYRQFPHEFSGGMRQRVMLAIAMANHPKILLADEPTTALDVTIQAQVMDVIRELQRQTHVAIVLITHDLGLVAEMANRVLVMYAGRAMEMGNVRDVFVEPRHPYTLGLMASVPRINDTVKTLHAIPGLPASMLALPKGCAFHPRCELFRGRATCRDVIPALREVGGQRLAACHFADEMPELSDKVFSAMRQESQS
jgi:oligopeptide/dipeptide ABC transporter ATP-binding protein